MHYRTSLPVYWCPVFIIQSQEGKLYRSDFTPVLPVMSHSEPFLRHLAIMCIDDVIHKTGNTYYIATLPEED